MKRNEVLDKVDTVFRWCEQCQRQTRHKIQAGEGCRAFICTEEQQELYGNAAKLASGLLPNLSDKDQTYRDSD